MKVNPRNLLNLSILTIVALARKTQADPYLHDGFYKHYDLQVYQTPDGGTIRLNRNSLRWCDFTDGGDITGCTLPEYVELFGSQWYKQAGINDLLSPPAIESTCGLELNNSAAGVNYPNVYTLIRSTSRGWGYKSWAWNSGEWFSALQVDISYNSTVKGIKNITACFQRMVDQYFNANSNDYAEKFHESRVAIANWVALACASLTLIISHRAALTFLPRKVHSKITYSLRNRESPAQFGENKLNFEKDILNDAHDFIFKELLTDRDYLTLREVNRNLARTILEKHDLLMSPKIKSKLKTIQSKSYPYAQYIVKNIGYIGFISALTIAFGVSHLMLNNLHHVDQHSLDDTGVSAGMSIVAYVTQPLLLLCYCSLVACVGNSSNDCAMGAVLRNKTQLRLFRKLAAHGDQTPDHEAPDNERYDLEAQLLPNAETGASYSVMGEAKI